MPESLWFRETDPVKTLQLIIKEVQSYLERRGGALIVDVECITSIVAEMARDDEDIARESVQLYNAFKTPKVRYDATARVFVFEPDCSKRSVIGAAASKIDMYRER